jgi:predicted acetyltransferase
MTGSAPRSPSSEVTVVALDASDRDALLTLDQSAFAFDTRSIDAVADTAMIEWDRAYAAVRDDERAGLYAVFSFGLEVPGARNGPTREIPAAGLSWVAVHPDHRRRGVLTILIGHHLETVRGAGREPVSLLFASEAAIYGRFGYGVATRSQRMTLPAHASLRGPEDDSVTTRFLAFDQAVHQSLLFSLAKDASGRRAGQTRRPVSHWERVLRDAPASRPSGGEPLRLVLAERDGGPTGFLLLRRFASWGDRGPEGTVRVVDVHAADVASEAALWRRAVEFDLMVETITPPLPFDHPLVSWTDDTTRTDTSRSYSLWVRIVDVPGALTARGYADNVDVVFDVSDDRVRGNAGRWRLVVQGDRVSCEKSGEPADLALDVRELGSAYLGGVTLAALGDAGLVQELTTGALVAASRAFSSELLPVTPPMF